MFNEQWKNYIQCKIDFIVEKTPMESQEDHIEKRVKTGEGNSFFFCLFCSSSCLRCLPLSLSLCAEITKVSLTLHRYGYMYRTSIFCLHDSNNNNNKNNRQWKVHQKKDSQRCINVTILRSEENFSQILRQRVLEGLSFLSPLSPHDQISFHTWPPLGLPDHERLWEDYNDIDILPCITKLFFC